MPLMSWVRVGILALCWGSSFLWIKLAVEAFSPVQIALARLALGATILLGYCLIRRIKLPRDGRTWALVTIPALIGNAIPFVLFGIGEQTVDSSLAGVLNATTPLWAIAIAVVFSLEQRPSWIQLTGVAVGFGGTIVIMAPWESTGGTLFGALTILLAAALYAVSYAITARYITGRGVAPSALAATQLLLATGMLAVVTPFAGLQPVQLTGAAPIIAVTILGAAGTGLAFLLNYRLVADEGATAATSVGYLLPVVSVLLGAVILSEPVGPRSIAGVALVLVGVGFARHRRKQPSVRIAAVDAQQDVADLAPRRTIERTTSGAN